MYILSTSEDQTKLSLFPCFFFTLELTLFDDLCREFMFAGAVSTGDWLTWDGGCRFILRSVIVDTQLTLDWGGRPECRVSRPRHRPLSLRTPGPLSLSPGPGSVHTWPEPRSRSLKWPLNILVSVLIELQFCWALDIDILVIKFWDDSWWITVIITPSPF